ncbi:MAG: class I SAM-dependent methyltransferase [Bdellovibrionales bacterium]|nr:class I SAM-dependent methyltransferase [Bdellovibrionales bacterium]
MKQKSCSICQALGERIRLNLSRAQMRTYWKCSECNFIEVDAVDRLAEEAAAEFYRNHENSVEDPRYREYAKAVADEATRRLSDANSSGVFGKALDYGCGAGPVVASLLNERGIAADQYDPVFFPDGIIEDSYALIVACEVVEHFREPKFEFSKVRDLLSPGGWLVVQTERLDFIENFEDWYYRRDPTHVAFYSERAFRRLGFEVGFDPVEVVDRKLVSMRRPY